MKSFKKYEAIINLSALSIGIISAVLHSVSMLFCRDALGYYTAEAIMPTVSNLFLVISILSFAVCAFFFTSKTVPTEAPRGIVSYFSLLPAAALLLHSVELVEQVIATSDILAAVTLAAALISAIFFILIPFSKEYSTLTALCGIGFVLWLGLSWLTSYRNLYVPMNAPEKMFFHFGCIGAALLVIGELRTMFGIPLPRFYRFSLWSAQALLLGASLPSVVGFLAKNVKSSVFFESVVLFCLAVYAIARSIAMIITSIKEKEEATEE